MKIMNGVGERFARILVALLAFPTIYACGAGTSDPAQNIPVLPPNKGPTPPFSGTIFVEPDIITGVDPTTFAGISYAGHGTRLVFDRRVDRFTTIDAFLFNATYSNGRLVEVQVNLEFGSIETAEIEARTYALELGRLPNVLLKDVDTVTIHRGVEPFGGGNRNVLIHTGQSEFYITRGILEETLVHEAAHTSLDLLGRTTDWIAARNADPTYISDYAAQFPEREDIAESFLMYLAHRYRRERLSDSVASAIADAIPNRIEYFDAQSFDIYPIN